MTTLRFGAWPRVTPLLLLIGCQVPDRDTGAGPGPDLATITDSGSPGAETVDTSVDVERRVFVAISGGGFHTHTAMSAWVSGLLRHNEEGIADLDGLFSPVRGFGCNSGGCWFLAHASYSSTFADGLLADAASDDVLWAQDGYLAGLQATYFDYMDGSGALPGTSDFLGGLYNLFPASEGRWYAFVEEAVYGPFGLRSEVGDRKLANPSDRLPWVQDKDLVVAVALAANKTVLREKDGWVGSYNQYFSALPVGRSQIESDYVPMLLAGPAPGRVPAPLLPAGDQDLWYYDNDTDTPIPITVPGDLEPGVSVFEATVVSSAALAIAASEGVLMDSFGVPDNTAAWISWSFADFAPPAWFTPSGLVIESTIRDQNKGFADFAAEQSVRLADGGFVDNSAVALLLRQMLENGDLKSGFEVTLFMNASYEGVDFYGYDINAGLAALFGHGGTDTQGYPGDGNIWFKPSDEGWVRIPSPHVFDDAPWTSDQLEFRVFGFQDEGQDVTLQVMQIPVTTIANTIYGTPSGVDGTLRVLEIRQLGSNAVPTESAEFDRYAALFRVLRDQAASDPLILDFLLDALGH